MLGRVTDFTLLEAVPNPGAVSTTGRDQGSQGRWAGPQGGSTHADTHVHAHIRAALDRTLHPALGS